MPVFINGVEAHTVVRPYLYPYPYRYPEHTVVPTAPA